MVRVVPGRMRGEPRSDNTQSGALTHPLLSGLSRGVWETPPWVRNDVKLCGSATPDSPRNGATVKSPVECIYMPAYAEGAPGTVQNRRHLPVWKAGTPETMALTCRGDQV